MPKRKCDACAGKGWVLITSSGSDFYADEDLHIERCDACEKFESDGFAESAWTKAWIAGKEKLPSHMPLTLYNGYFEFYINRKRRKETKRASTRKRKA